MTPIDHLYSALADRGHLRFPSLDLPLIEELTEHGPEKESEPPGRPWISSSNEDAATFAIATSTDNGQSGWGDIGSTGSSRISSDPGISQAVDFAAPTEGASSTNFAATAASTPASPEKIADYMSNGFWRETGQIPHAFDTSQSDILTVSLVGLSATEKTMARGALEAWSMVADITFKEVSGSADIRFHNSGSKALTNVYYAQNGDITYADVFVGTQWATQNGSTIGSYSFQTYIHEVGHALGLGHSGNYSSNSGTTYSNDSWQMSVMSYNSQTENTVVDASFAYLASAMIADVIAIKTLYGVEKGGATAGNTIYGVDSNLGNYLDAFFDDPKAGLSHNALTIFDEGGVDRINLADDTTRQVVNLNGSTYSNVYGLIGNLAVAKGTVIENYTGGSNADKITGNSAANSIKAGSGSDTVFGAEGNDLISLDDGNDIGSGADGQDTVSGGNGHDVLSGGSGRDTLKGDGGNDSLNGDSDDDVLNGGSQNDTLEAGSGNDVLIGGEGSDKLRGGDGNDQLSGGSGNDSQDGGAGNDFLGGGSGTDAFIFALGRDIIDAFENDRDELRLDDSLWQGKKLTIDQVLDYARVVNGDLFFDFGNGNQLTIKNLTNVDALCDDLMIF